MQALDSMLVDAPRHLPPLAAMLSDLGNPSAEAIARHLGVSRRTVYRWLLAGKAPRAAMLALFWSTRWGRSAVECRAVNDATLQAAIARNALEQAQRRLREVEHLLALGNFGSANQPLVAVDLAPVRPPAALDQGQPFARPAPVATEPARPAAKSARQRVNGRRAVGR